MNASETVYHGRILAAHQVVYVCIEKVHHK